MIQSKTKKAPKQNPRTTISSSTGRSKFATGQVKRSQQSNKRDEIKGAKKTLSRPQAVRQLADQRGEKINPFDHRQGGAGKLRVNAEQSLSIKNMATKDILEKAKKELADVTGFKSPSAIGFKQEGNDLVATIEVIEKTSIPDGMDVLGTYEVRVDQSGKIISYERTDLRKRGDTTFSKAA